MDVMELQRPQKRYRSVLLVIVASFVGPGAWAAAPKITFNIPAGEFSQAIVEFYKQSRIEILYASIGSVSEVKTRAVVGELEVTEALTRMLEGTGFTFEFENAHSVLVKRSSESADLARAGTAEASNPERLGDAHTQLLNLAGDSGKSQQANMEEVVVTGSLIRGVLDIMSPLIHVTKNDMKSTAYATVQDALLALPLNSNAGMNEEFGGVGNFNLGFAPNLRGLGFGATLVLVNGHRQPPAGTAGDFVDISNIPWSAVERVEVLADGTSALYGSDAIAGVVNIIMRKDLEGFETQTRYGMTGGGANEVLAAQLFGDRWDGGNWLLAYQYSERTALAAADRAYAADPDKTSLGGTNHRSFRSNPTNILDPITFEPAFAVPRGQDGRSLAPSDLLPEVVNTQNTFSQFDLLPDREMHSVFFTASQKLGERLELFSEGRFSQRKINKQFFGWDELLVVPATNAFFVDPFGGSHYVLVAYNFLNDLGALTRVGETRSYTAMLRMKADLDNAWSATLSASYGGESLHTKVYNLINFDALNAALADPNPATAFNPFGDGSYTNPATLEAIRFTRRERAVSGLATLSLIADGPFFSLPSGAVKLAIGAERRQESLYYKLRKPFRTDFRREITSGFAELSMPLVGNPDDPRAIPRLEFSLAGRYESYSDFGSTFNPKMGLRWAPFESVKFRTSWGSSFKAPNFLDLYNTSNNVDFLIPFPDPRSPSGQSLLLGRQGNSSNLSEETAKTWTAGIDLAPVIAPGFELSLTYYAVDYEDRIIQPGPPSPFDILFEEDQWAEVITRNPSQAQIDEVCNSPGPFFGGSREDCAKSSPAVLIDFRLKNLAVTKTKGLDVKLDYSLNTNRGNFNVGLLGNYVLSFEQAFTKTSQLIDIVDTYNNPLALRMRTTTEWNQRGRNQPGFSVNVNMNHSGSYWDTTSQPAHRIDASTTFDFRLSYRTVPRGNWSDNLEIDLNAINVFDKDPPFVDDEFGYDLLNFRPLGRVISFSAQKKW